MFVRIVSLMMLALLASAPVSAHSKHHQPCPNELNGVRGTVEVTGSTLGLTAEVVQGCGFEVVEIKLCQTDVTPFYGCPAPLPSSGDCPLLAAVSPLPIPCAPCFGTSTEGVDKNSVFAWQNAQEYHVRARVKFCEPFYKCQLPSIAVTLQTRRSLTGLDDCGLNQAANVAYNLQGLAIARLERHPLTVRTVSQTEFEVSAILTIFAENTATADSVFNDIFDPTADEILRTKVHFQAEKECVPCCAPASAHSKHHEPCPNELNGVRGTIEVTGSVFAGLTTEVVQGCGFEVVEIKLCQTDVTDFYGCPVVFPDVNTCPLFIATPNLCAPCFGQTKNASFETTVVWQNVQEYLIRARIKFCKPFCPCQLPSIALTLQSRSGLAGIDDCGPFDIENKPRATNVVYDPVNQFAVARFEVHPATIRSVSPEEFEASFILTIFAPIGGPAPSSVANDIFDGIFDPTADVRLRQHLHFQAEKECAPCCATGSCL